MRWDLPWSRYAIDLHVTEHIHQPYPKLFRFFPIPDSRFPIPDSRKLPIFIFSLILVI
ncbi:MAG: hypothetical protein F6J90_30870 [Moorea sp. SIOASIH]|uniref:hypothetical protein n=1 Tax=Moorena sp. SIOASIH TaxID=2607817 RepID=UPI0013BBE9B5|nr:hypothetical protein [Moorena sp. SIOASIH]NEO40504.1 hypothetical protein [Moorena sp. SIOASIH]